MYVDANIFAFSILASDNQARRAQEFLDSLEKYNHAITSVLVLDELMWVLRKHGHAELIPTVIEELYSINNLTITDIPSFIPLNAAELMEKHNLKPRDAFHLAIMEHFNIKEIATDDKDFDKIPGIKRVKV